MFLSYLWARDWGGCEQGVCVALTFCMGAGDAWHVTRDVVMTCDWPSPCPLSSPASVSDQMTTNCHQSQQNSGKISTRIIFVRRTGVIQTSHTRGETVIISRCHVLSPHCWWAQCTHCQCSQLYRRMSGEHLSSRPGLNILVMKTHPSRYRFMIGPLGNWVLPSVITSQM